MNIDLTDTTSSQINTALVQARRAAGTPAVGMVLTLVIVTDEGNHYDALRAANEASKEHPSRILVVIKRPGRSPRDRRIARLDAEVRVGGESGTGETVLLRLHGELANHDQSVVLPLLLPDAPVVVWWPESAPEHPSEDLLGQLGTRRITDAQATEDPLATLLQRARTYTPGDTDLAWTRITPWRSMLAAALDQRHPAIVSAVVQGEAYNPSTELLALWLAERLRVPVHREVSEGPGLTAVRLQTADGGVCLDRADGTLAELAMPGQPDRHVALQRREVSELIAEELRHLDPDETYASTIRFGASETGREVLAGQDGSHDGGRAGGRAASDSGSASSGSGSVSSGSGSVSSGSGSVSSGSGSGDSGSGSASDDADPESGSRSGQGRSGRAKQGSSGRGGGGKAAAEK